MIKLPTNWKKVKLVDLAEDISYGYTASSAQKNVGPHLLRITDIQNNHVSWNDVPHCVIDQKKVQKYLLQENDLVFARTGATVGKSFLIKGKIPDSVFASYLIRVRPLQPKSANYLAYYFQSNDYWLQITEFSAGIGQPNVNGSKLKELSIPLPPLAEQTRIAHKLDELLAQVDTLKTRIDSIPALIKRFRQSVLAAAVSGSLTQEWRSKNSGQTQLSKPPADNIKLACGNSIPIGWNLKKAEEICGFITKGTTPSKEKMSAGLGQVPYIKVYNLTFKGTLDFSVNPTFIDADTHSTDLKRSIIKPGDVLMNIVGPPLGKVSIVPTTFPEWNINQAIARFRASDGISSGYLALCLRTENVLTHAISRAKATAGQLNLTLEICRELPIPVPPEAEQTEIVRKVEQLFAFADQLEAKVASAKARIDHLTQSILAKAFRGELVPQDPNDEPASVLLERIKAKRAAAPKPKRSRKASA